jgi:hypothetical protein
MQADGAWWSLLAFVIGGASGIQDVFEKYRRESVPAIATRAGVFYLFSRGVFPAVVFLILLRNGTLKDHLWAYSIVIGTGAELFMRSSFYIKQTPRPEGGIDELLRGPLTLLKWYQNLFLVEFVSAELTTKRLTFVVTHLPSHDFQTLCTIVTKNLDAWTDEGGRAAVERKVVELSEAFERERPRAGDLAAILRDQAVPSRSPSSQLDELYRRKLGFAVLNIGGQTIFKTLFS